MLWNICTLVDTRISEIVLVDRLLRVLQRTKVFMLSCGPELKGKIRGYMFTGALHPAPAHITKNKQ